MAPRGWSHTQAATFIGRPWQWLPLLMLLLLQLPSPTTAQHPSPTATGPPQPPPLTPPPPSPTALAHFGAVFVINLAARTDRLADITRTLHTLHIANATLVRAVPHPCGSMGCTLSHILALQQCWEAGVASCLILEDDFAVKNDDAASVWSAVDAFFKDAAPVVPWDVFMLSANVYHSHATRFPWLHRVDEAQTTSGYAVARRYVRTLLRNYLSGAIRLNDACPTLQLSLDQFWKRLQKRGRWYVLHPTVGYQRASFSDIEGEVKDYGVR